MHNLSDKEKKVIRELLLNSDRSRKTIAYNIGISESDFSRTITNLTNIGVIKKFTIDIDYPKIGYPDVGIFMFSLKDKKFMEDVILKLRSYNEIIEIQEVFGEYHDMFIRIMAENNERIRIICREISNMEEIKSDARTFTLIFALNYKKENGVSI